MDDRVYVVLRTEASRPDVPTITTERSVAEAAYARAISSSDPDTWVSENEEHEQADVVLPVDADLEQREAYAWNQDQFTVQAWLIQPITVISCTCCLSDVRSDEIYVIGADDGSLPNTLIDEPLCVTCYAASFPVSLDDGGANVAESAAMFSRG